MAVIDNLVLHEKHTVQARANLARRGRAEEIGCFRPQCAAWHANRLQVYADCVIQSVEMFLGVVLSNVRLYRCHANIFACITLDG